MPTPMPRLPNGHYFVLKVKWGQISIQTPFRSLKLKFLKPCFRSGDNLMMYLKRCCHTNSSASCLTLMVTYKLARIRIPNLTSDEVRTLSSNYDGNICKNY